MKKNIEILKKNNFIVTSKTLNIPITDFAIEEFEIIGNVGDNLELLKEGSV